MSIDSVDDGFNAMIWEGLEAVLLPPFFSEEENFVKDVTEIFYRFIQFALFLPCAIISSLARFTARSFQQNPEGFAAVAQCSELWEAIHIQEVMLPPLGERPLANTSTRGWKIAPTTSGQNGKEKISPWSSSLGWRVIYGIVLKLLCRS